MNTNVVSLIKLLKPACDVAVARLILLSTLHAEYVMGMGIPEDQIIHSILNRFVPEYFQSQPVCAHCLSTFHCFNCKLQVQTLNISFDFEISGNE